MFTFLTSTVGLSTTACRGTHLQTRAREGQTHPAKHVPKNDALKVLDAF